MHGLPNDTDLTFLVGREVTQVAVGGFQTSIHFDRDIVVAIEGDCELDAIRFKPGADAGRQLLSLLGRTVASATPIDGRHLELRFDDGRILKVVESDEEFESFSVTGPGVTIVV